MVQNAPLPLDFDDKMCFSYPLNVEYPNSIAFSGIQSGVLMAYSSGNLIIVLSHCQYIKAILNGHKGTIVSITFEMRGPHIIACDMYGIFYFWHYNDTGYEKSRVVEFGIPATCISWFPARREISISTKKGLFCGGIHNFGKTNLVKLNNRSTFCQFNSDGTLLASHHNNKIVTFYIFSSSLMTTQVVVHLCPVIQFDFHPYLSIFLSITSDLVLHIWRLTSTSNFVCTSRIKVNNICRFIKYPIYFLEKMKTDQKPARIAYIDQQHKISSIKIDRNGQILNEDKIHFSANSNMNSRLLMAFKTNFGVGSAIIQENGILISSKSGYNRQIFYHTSNISQISFQEKENWIFTLDELGSLIVWPIFDTYYSSNLVSHNTSHAVWYNEQSLLFLQFNQLFLYNIYTSDTKNFLFQKFSDCVDIFIDKNEVVYLLTKTEIVLKENRYKIPEFSHHSFSFVDNNHFILVLSLKSTSQLIVYMMPEFKEIKCATRNHKESIKSIACLSVDSFAVLDEENIEFWNYDIGIFNIRSTIQLPKMKFIKCCSSFLFSCDENNLYLIENGIYRILNEANISCVTTNRSGTVAYSHDKSFSVIPSPFNDKKMNEIKNIESNHQILRNNLISPFDYLNPQKETLHVIYSTLLHLLEYESLSDFIPRQIPAVPNQLAFHLEFPKSIKIDINGNDYSFDFNGKNYLGIIDSEKKDDFDLFALRYLYSIHESALPFSYFSLWLSFSLHQSEVSDYLINMIDTNSLTKFYIPLCIHDHQLLVKIVKASVQKAWSVVQKVENVALLLISLGQQLVVSKLYKVIGDMQRSDYFTNDFTTQRYRKSAIKNAYSSLCHNGYEMSAALFIIAGEVKLGVKVILEKMQDPVLAFLVLRLLTNSDYNCEMMKWFLSVVLWRDDIIQILISHLTDDKNIIELFERNLLETEKTKNMSTFGDRRIALFQIYYNLAVKRNHNHIVLYQVARNLCFDGLAPLAKYLIESVNCPYTTARPILLKKSEICEDVVQVLTEEKVDQIESANDEVLNEIGSFNFGGASNLSDIDDWSDSDSESKDNEIEEVKYEEKDILDEQKQKLQKEQEEQEEQKSANEIDSIVEKSIQKRSFYLSKIFTNCTTINEDDTNESKIKDNEAGRYALSIGHIEMAANLFDKSMTHQLEIHLSQFIQFCSLRFLFSASIPIKPSELYSLCMMLLKLTTKKEKILPDFILMGKYDKDGFSVFSFLGLFVVSLWTYHHNLLYHLLNTNEKIQQINLKIKKGGGDKDDIIKKENDMNKESNEKSDNNSSLDEIPPPCSLFDIDISSSRFPDTIPTLLQCYLSENLHGLETSLERDRLLIMFLIYSLMLEKFSTLFEYTVKRNPKASITNDNDSTFSIEEMYNKLYEILQLRKASISKVIEFYQIALNCPSLSPPPLPDLESATAVQLFCRAVINEHLRSRKLLMQIQQRILSKMPISFVINWKLSIDESRMNKSVFKVPENSFVRGAVVAPLDSCSLIVASTNSVFSVNLETSNISPEKNLNKNGSGDDPLQVIAHPHLNLVLVISPFSTSFYDFNNVVGSKVIISFKHQQGMKYTCAQFSPNGEKVAICSTVVEVYFFDFSTEKQSPFITVDVNGSVSSIIWLNYDTFLIVAYTSNKEKTQKLALINILSSYITPLPIDPCLNGKINVMEIERRNGFLLLGTKSGKAAIFELVTVNDLKLKWLYDFKKTEVTSVAALNNLFAFGTVDGDVLLANLENENGNACGQINMKLLKVQFAVTSIIIEMERIIVAGYADYFEVWKAGEYF